MFVHEIGSIVFESIFVFVFVNCICILVHECIYKNILQRVVVVGGGTQQLDLSGHKEVWHLHAATLVIVMDTHTQTRNILAGEIQLDQKYSWTQNTVSTIMQLDTALATLEIEIDILGIHTPSLTLLRTESTPLKWLFLYCCTSCRESLTHLVLFGLRWHRKR